MRNRPKKILIILTIYLLPVLLAAIFLVTKIFPKKSYLFNPQNLEKSTLIFNDQQSFTITPFNELTKTLIDFKSVSLNIKTNPPSPLNNQKVTVQKGFAASFYPVGKKIEKPPFEVRKYKNRYYLIGENEKKLIPTIQILNTYLSPKTSNNPNLVPSLSEEEHAEIPLAPKLAGFRDGTLIQYRDSIFVITDGKKMIISSPEIFDKLKYDWGKIIPATAAEARIHSNSPLPLTLESAHPDGTLLWDPAARKNYLINRGEKLELDNDFISTYFAAITPIKIENKDYSEVCVLKNNHCQTKLDQAFKAQEGNAYNFQLSQDPTSENLANAQISVVFSRNFSWINLKNTLKTLKQ